MTKTLILSALVALVVTIVVSVVTPSPKQIIREIPGLGAVVSSETLTSPTCIDGVCIFSTKRNFTTTASTTICAIKSPSATSTILRATINVTTGSSTAATLYLATSTTAFATTTNLVTYTLSANTQASTNFVGTAASVVPPGIFLVLGAAGGPANGHLLVGSCSVDFRKIN